MKSLTLLSLVVVSVGFCACGGDEVKDDAPTGEQMSMAGAPTSGDEPLELNGCKTSSFDDQSGDDGERVVQIAVDGLKFTPPCLTIAVGQRVSFEGSLPAHPLAPGNPEDATAGSPDSPIVQTSSGNSVAFTFESAGTFPYFCELHSFGTGQGMVGAIYVREE